MVSEFLCNGEMFRTLELHFFPKTSNSHKHARLLFFFERQSGLDIVLKFKKKKKYEKKPLNEMFSLMTSCVTVHRKMRW